MLERCKFRERISASLCDPVSGRPVSLRREAGSSRLYWCRPTSCWERLEEAGKLTVKREARDEREQGSERGCPVTHKVSVLVEVESGARGRALARSPPSCLTAPRTRFQTSAHAANSRALIPTIQNHLTPSLSTGARFSSKYLPNPSSVEKRHERMTVDTARATR